MWHHLACTVRLFYQEFTFSHINEQETCYPLNADQLDEHAAAAL
jgi:hypothetical protein